MWIRKQRYLAIVSDIKALTTLLETKTTEYNQLSVTHRNKKCTDISCIKERYSTRIRSPPGPGSRWSTICRQRSIYRRCFGNLQYRGRENFWNSGKGYYGAFLGHVISIGSGSIFSLCGALSRRFDFPRRYIRYHEERN